MERVAYSSLTANAIGANGSGTVEAGDVVGGDLEDFVIVIAVGEDGAVVGGLFGQVFFDVGIVVEGFGDIRLAGDHIERDRFLFLVFEELGDVAAQFREILALGDSRGGSLTETGDQAFGNQAGDWFVVRGIDFIEREGVIEGIFSQIEVIGH